MHAWRIGLAASGIAVVVYGTGRLLTQIPLHSLTLLAGWLIAALIIHDGLVSPAVVAVGWTLRRLVPARARRHLQAALIMSAIVTLIAVPMIYRANRQPPSKAILRQNFAGNLGLLVTVIAVVTLIAYAVQVTHDGHDRTSSSPPGSAARRPLPRRRRPE
jgi:phosphatidylglycerophosphate synthase